MLERERSKSRQRREKMIRDNRESSRESSGMTTEQVERKIKAMQPSNRKNRELVTKPKESEVQSLRKFLDSRQK